MPGARKIIKIDEEKCTGCGQCIIACAEGALKLVEGKARLVGDVYCDGLGACIGECPEGALTIIEREAEEFDEAAVEDLLQKNEAGRATHGHEETLACGCPGTAARALSPRGSCGCSSLESSPSGLGHWPIKLQLLGPSAPFLKGSDLVLLADCAGVSYPDLHSRLLPGKAVAIGCPKLDDLEAHIERLALILKEAKPRSLTVVHMEVPCCRGFVFGAEKAIEKSGTNVPLKRIQISVDGKVQEEEDLTEYGPKASTG